MDDTPTAEAAQDGHERTTANEGDEELGPAPIAGGIKMLASTGPDADGSKQNPSRLHVCMDFTSIFLFLVGSTFYMVLSVEDYKYAKELLSLPTYVMTADDDATFYSYIAENDDHNYEDDYVPGMQMNGAPVSTYQIFFLVGSLCFAIAGMLDIINERDLWHSFRLLAGVFGVASAVYISGIDFHLSNIFNLVSVHFYLLDSLTMLRHDRCCAVTMESGKWTKRYLLFGDLAYFSGSVIDVVCAYLWVFDNTSDWDVTLTIFENFGSALWIICALIYMWAFFKGDFEAGENGARTRRLSSLVIDSVRGLNSSR
ncbi:hypothetical protein ACHAW5_001598 [Stephanodiscus triporus]|uniref:Uncharacterized protein n=1 Tax=Stephanodiscus triporus TaxID=2934178 RepID=A0ABD3PBQ7_9STRA